MSSRVQDSKVQKFNVQGSKFKVQRSKFEVLRSKFVQVVTMNFPNVEH